jgi:hypothetical protein
LEEKEPDPLMYAPLCDKVMATGPGWSTTRRGRQELLAVTVFCLASVVVPLWRLELYPFSRAPMFADAPGQYCTYTILDPHNRVLPLHEFGLHRNYWGNPLGEGVGFQPLPSVDEFGLVASQEKVVAAVQETLRQRQDLPYIEVIQEVIGPLDEQRIGPIQSSRWRVDNLSLAGRQP